jgi:hypothetical protein
LENNAIIGGYDPEAHAYSYCLLLDSPLQLSSPISSCGPSLSYSCNPQNFNYAILEKIEILENQIKKLQEQINSLEKKQNESK